MRQPSTTAAVAALALVLFGSGTALAATPGEKCEVGKLGTAGKYATCLLKAQQKLVKGGGTDTAGYDEDVLSCSGKYSDKWQSFEDKAEGMCPSSGDASSVQDFLDSCIVTAEEALHGGTLPLDVTTCNTNLGTCSGNLGTCNTNLSSTSSALGTCNGNLGTCTTDLSTTNADLGTCSTDLSTTNADLGTCNAIVAKKPRFRDNGDGTVTDTLMQLSWEKKSTDGTVHDVGNTYTWSTGTNDFDGTAKTVFLDKLNDVAGGGAHCFAGHCDWRLPSEEGLLNTPGEAMEFNTIYDPTQGGCGGGSGACVIPALGVSQTDVYWTSTTSIPFPDYVDGVGYMFGDPATGRAKVGAFFTRAVRDENAATPRFIDNGDGTVTDTVTNLMWEKKTADGTVHDVGNTYTWSTGTNDFDGTAKTVFLDELNDVAGGGAHCFADYCDWRLPSEEGLLNTPGEAMEFNTIYDPTQGGCGGGSGPCVIPALGLSQTDVYWTSTTSIPFPDYVDGVGYMFGDPTTGRAKVGAYFVRAVRGGS